MAQPRTFQFYGVAYGNIPVNLTASINGTTVFSGAVPTTTDPFPVPPANWPLSNAQGVLFSIDNSSDLNTDFSGSLPLTITVTGGEAVILQNILCNYYLGNTKADPNAGTAGNFSYSYTGTPVNSENSTDSRSSVVINGVAQPAPNHAPNNGNWAWELPTGQTMTHNWNISVGVVANVAGNTSTYSGAYSSFLKA
jgi:hypothetical protein